MTSDQGPNFSNVLAKHAASHASDGFDPLVAGVLGLDVFALQSQLLTGRNTSDYTHPQNNTTLANVPGLTVALAASSVYLLFATFVYNSGAVPDFKFGFNGPAGYSGWQEFYGSTGGFSTQQFSIATLGMILDGTAADQPVFIRGQVVTTTAGDLQFQAAQNTANASNTKVLANSSILAVKIA